MILFLVLGCRGLKACEAWGTLRGLLAEGVERDYVRGGCQPVRRSCHGISNCMNLAATGQYTHSSVSRGAVLFCYRSKVRSGRKIHSQVLLLLLLFCCFCFVLVLVGVVVGVDFALTPRHNLVRGHKTGSIHSGVEEGQTSAPPSSPPPPPSPAPVAGGGRGYTYVPVWHINRVGLT